VIVMRQSATIGDSLDVLDDLYYRNPTVAVLLLILMLSLAGIPPTADFMSKYLIFQALIETHHPALAISASLSMIPGLYYYLRVVGHAWMREPGAVPSPEPNSAEAVALAVTLFVTVAAGLYAEPFTRLARYALCLRTINSRKTASSLPQSKAPRVSAGSSPWHSNCRL
jgi:NADH-quinone oxidoreductase subunit N